MCQDLQTLWSTRPAQVAVSTVLDRQSDVVLRCKTHAGLDVLRPSSYDGVKTDAALAAGHRASGAKVTCLVLGGSGSPVGRLQASRALGYENGVVGLAGYQRAGGVVEGWVMADGSQRPDGDEIAFHGLVEGGPFCRGGPTGVGRTAAAAGGGRGRCWSGEEDWE